MSAMTLHLEQGRCASGATRAKVNKVARVLDRHHLVTNPARLIEGGSVASTYATDCCFNGSMWECFLCSRDFWTKSALNAHINSPRHEEKVYRCPKGDCGREFTTLSGIFQHVESEACGVYNMRGARDAMAQLTSGMRRLGV